MITGLGTGSIHLISPIQSRKQADISGSGLFKGERGTDHFGTIKEQQTSSAFSTNMNGKSEGPLGRVRTKICPTTLER